MAPASSLSLPRPFGPYELVRQLAVGGMAEVFVARARSVAGFEKVVALKMIHPRFSEDPEFARLLVEEANITAQLSHRNIVQVIDLGQIDGTHYIAMEYVDGMDLSRLLAKMRERNQRCSPRFAAYIVREVCDGLEHAHRKVGNDGKPLKIVHRDVSPPNILVSSAGEVKLTDFGIAKAALRASSTEAGVVKGKYAYMPPEQAKGQPLDARADVFSAGCVLYELATGQPVYKDAPLPVLLDRVSRGVFDAPEKVRPDLPPALIAVIKKALAISPDARYSNARAMADELNAFLYTLPPNPEFEVSQIVSGISESSRASMPPMAGVSLFDDDEEVSTQIESMAAMRQKMTDGPAAGASGNTAKHAAVKPAATVRSNAPDPDAFTDEPTRAMPRGKFAGVIDGPAPMDDDEPEPTVQGVRPNTAAPRVMGSSDGAAGPTVRPAAGRPATAPSATSSSKPGGAPLPTAAPRQPTGTGMPALGAAKGAPAVPTGGARPMPSAEPKLPARKPTLMGAAVAPTAPPQANPPPTAPKKPSLPPPPPASAKRQSLPPPPPPGAARSATGSSPPANKPGPPPVRTPALPPSQPASPPREASPPPAAPRNPPPPSAAPATQSAPPSFGAPAPAPMNAPPMQQQPAFGAPPSQPDPASQFGAPNGGAFGGPPPQQQPNAFGGGDAFGNPPQQPQQFGQAPQNMPNAFAQQQPGATAGYPAQQQQQQAMQRAAQAREEDAKQRRAVIIAGAFAVIGVAALVVVLFSGR